MCILENVKNLKTHDNQNTYKTIENELLKRGYNITSEVINAADYGSPQARQRIFIFATKNKPFTIPLPEKTTSTVVSTIVDFAIVDGDLDLLKYTVKEKKVITLFNPNKPRVLYDVFPILSPEKKQLLDASKAELLQQGGDPTSLDKGGRQGERVYSIDAVGITVCASSGGPGAKTGLYKVGKSIRRLSVGETLKMFGFPDNYNFLTVSSENSLFYLGNSIVVNVPLAFAPFIESWF
jgi:DNA (cytosine-5)-methyltransferase 1